MMKTQSAVLGASTAAFLLALGIGSSRASAQSPTPGAAATRVTLQGRGLDVREALRSLFKQAGTSYTLAPEVQGTVAADFRDLGLEDALRLVLRQVDATWRTEGGVIQILSRETAAGRLPPGVMFVSPDPVFDTIVSTPPPIESPTMVADADSLYILRQGVVHKVNKATMKEVGKVDLNPRRIKITY